MGAGEGVSFCGDTGQNGGMDATEASLVVFDEDTCWERLKTRPVGRLVTRVEDAVDIVPINYVVDGDSIVFRTAAGSKLAALAINSSVVFETDEFDDERGWSVVLHGRAKALELEDEVAAAEQLPLKPFVATLKPTFVRVTAESLTGRSYKFGPEPRREDVQEG